jgi:O-antigen/teichoic acid export membrane protein
MEKRQIINTTIWFRVMVSIITGILILVFRGVAIGYVGSSIWAVLLLYLPLLLCLAGLETSFETILQGLTIGIVLNLIFTLVFIVYLKVGILGLIYAKLIPIAVQLIIAVAYAGIKYRLEFNIGILRKMLAFGFPLQIQYTMDFVFSRIDTIIIASFLGTTQAAFLEVARRIPDSLMMLYDAFRSVYFPMLTGANEYLCENPYVHHLFGRDHIGNFWKRHHYLIIFFALCCGLSYFRTLDGRVESLCSGKHSGF